MEEKNNNKHKFVQKVGKEYISGSMQGLYKHVRGGGGSEGNTYFAC